MHKSLINRSSIVYVWGWSSYRKYSAKKPESYLTKIKNTLDNRDIFEAMCYNYCKANWKSKKLIVMPVDGIFISLVISGFLFLSTISVIGYLIYAFCMRCTNYLSDDSRSDAFEYEDNVTPDNISLNELNHIWLKSKIFQIVEMFEIKCHYYYENHYCSCFKFKHLIIHIFSNLAFQIEF